MRNIGESDISLQLSGIPLTVQSARPSSRSSLRSSGSIGSYGNRRSSSIVQSGTTGIGSKGILVSTSRTGAARSAAILLISCHISAIKKQNQNKKIASNNRYGSGYGGGSSSCGGDDDDDDPFGDNTMTKHLQRQLNHQRQLLNLELSPARNHNKFRTLLGMNGIDNRSQEDDLNSLDNGNSLQIGALPTPASDTPRFAVKDNLKKITTKKCFRVQHRFLCFTENKISFQILQNLIN